MVVHAHPDDECLGTGGTLARYSAEGIRTVLVTATKGEEGEMHDPDLVEDEVRPRMAEIREGELRRAVAILGVTDLEFLGYRDSGMMGTPANERPENFHNADPEEAVGRLVRLIRHYRPQVLATYNEDGGYGHPDHLQCHRVTAADVDAAADPARFPEAGPAWAPGKFYAIAWSREAMRAFREEMKARGLQWPRDNDAAEEAKAAEATQTSAETTESAGEEEEWGQPEETITAFIDTRGYAKTVHEALRQHRTQPVGFFTELPEDLVAMTNSRDYYVLVRSRVEDARPEDDLFAGIRG
jgi:N-acetyl-1-D-myo-inositol-2-amino-2-deoxy-alpha-D-glucopyranoside deacetylase